MSSSSSSSSLKFGISVALTALSIFMTRAAADCTPVIGSFNIHSPALYPENADWDQAHCKLYLSSLYNETVLRYDPYTKEQEILHFPGISGNADYHVSGVYYDAWTQAIYFGASSAAAYSAGSHLTGPNALIKWDTQTDKLVYIVKWENKVEQIKWFYNTTIGGFQDITTDLVGNAYHIASFGNVIMKAAPDGTPSIWYISPNAAVGTEHQAYGWPGIFTAADGTTLVLIDSSTGRITTFDTMAKHDPFKYITPNSTYMPTNLPAGSYNFDKFYAPPIFGGGLALASNDGVGTVVLRSNDGWASCEYLGTVPDDKAASMGGFGTATVQISDRLFEVFEFFEGLDGTRGSFPLVEITNQVLNML